MTTPATQDTSTKRSLPKAPTGIQGLDELTRGGLPRGRPTLLCGSAGCGKTVLGIEFLVRGATQFDEPGVLMAFEETAEELTVNVRSLGFDLDELVRQKKLALDYVRIERSEIEETGEYDLEGLFVRLGTPSTRLEPSVSSWTRLKPCSLASRTQPSCGPNCGGCSVGSSKRA